VTATLGSAVLFLLVVGLVIAVGITVGMIVAGRIDRIMAPPRPAAARPADPAAEPQSDSAHTEEHDE
jgi:hypothetical protein